MPSDQQHISQAVRNYTVLEHLSRTLPDEQAWMITIQYYFILHLTKAHLRRAGIPEADLGTHTKTRDQIRLRQNRTDPFLNSTFGKDSSLFLTYYTKLENLSQRARYLGIYGSYHPIDEQAWFDAIVVTDELLNYFLQNHWFIGSELRNSRLSPITFSVNMVNTTTAWQPLSGLLTIR
jgi:hypothetical protein